MHPYSGFEPYPEQPPHRPSGYPPRNPFRYPPAVAHRPSAQVKWWIAPLIAVPLGVFVLVFMVATFWGVVVTVPLLFIVLAIAVSVCFVLSKWWANAHVVGVGLMLSVAPPLLIGLSLVSGRQ